MADWLEALREFWLLVWSLLKLLWKAGVLATSMATTAIGAWHIVLWFLGPSTPAQQIGLIVSTASTESIALWCAGCLTGIVIMHQQVVAACADRDRIRSAYADLREELLGTLEKTGKLAGLASIYAHEDPKQAADLLAEAVENVMAKLRRKDA